MGSYRNGINPCCIEIEHIVRHLSMRFDKLITKNGILREIEDKYCLQNFCITCDDALKSKTGCARHTLSMIEETIVALTLFPQGGGTAVRKQTTEDIK